MNYEINGRLLAVLLAVILLVPLGISGCVAIGAWSDLAGTAAGMALLCAVFCLVDWGMNG